ncbi:protein SCO1 homolog 2, mitochondrial-like [Raphanus sativus]|uniref:Protein SCO1 homolog 2, mitochondrial-like n=1 Tax=Raphanus sativus TaxID=3726 RepID=A0A9W3CBD4_RAPSA|nr:protein SCO1 homolog 2, mitochondrial-like [Raphanus sativus]
MIALNHRSLVVKMMVSRLKETTNFVILYFLYQTLKTKGELFRKCQPSSSNRIGCGCGSNTTAFCYLLKMISRAVDKLESNHDQKILPVFVTLDPVRNTPSHLHAYLKEFDDRILGLTGSASAMRQMAQEYRVYFKKVQEDGDDYLVDTSHNMYLLNPKMEVVRCFGVEYNPDDLSQEVLKEVSSLSQ